MILTKIKKEKDKYLLIFDNNLEILVNEELIVSNLLLVGKKLSLKEIEQLKNENVYYSYYEKALKYISKTICSEYTLYNYLINKDASCDIAKKVCNALKDKKLLDDNAYFKYLANYCLRHNYGKYYIINKAKTYNISNEIVDDVLNNISYEEFYNSCLSLASKYILNGDISKMPLKLKRYLFQRGFETDMILSVCERINYEERKIY